MNGKKALTVHCNMLIDEKVKYDEIVKINTTDWAEKNIYKLISTEKKSFDKMISTRSS